MMMHAADISRAADSVRIPACGYARAAYVRPRQLAAAQDIPSTVYQNLVKTTVQRHVWRLWCTRSRDSGHDADGAGKLASHAQFEVVVHDVAIHVENVPKDIDANTVQNAQVVQRDHVDEADVTSDADTADTLEQISLIATLVLLMMGLLSYLVNLSQPTTKELEADTTLETSGLVTAVTVALATVALIAAMTPFAATYWYFLYKHPDDRHLALMLKPLERWLAPCETASDLQRPDVHPRARDEEAGQERGATSG
jgi:hypothetical protein